MPNAQAKNLVKSKATKTKRTVLKNYEKHDMYASAIMGSAKLQRKKKQRNVNV